MRNFSTERIIQFGIGLCLILNSLQAYSIFSIPVPWMGTIFLVFLSLFFFLQARFFLFPGAVAFLFFTCWVVVDFLVILIMRPSEPVSLARATLGYYPYIMLRLLNIVVCAFSICLIFWLIYKGRKKQLVSLVVNLGLIVSVYSIYVYFAQTHGWPEFSRTRLGTGGDEQATTFTYAFHRAMGTFREPSHLAEWLVLPLFVSLYENKKLSNFKAALMATVLLMTGSLTGIAGFLGGSACAAIIGFRFSWSALWPVIKIVGLTVFAGVVFALFVNNSTDKKNSSFVVVLWERVEPILLEKGLKSSNRDYVYYYLDHKPFTIFGDGIGNPNIEFSKFLDSDITASFLSLYVATLYSAGYIGFSILVLFLLCPVVLFYRKRSKIKDNQFFYLFSAYFGWLIVFSIHSEELNFQFGVCYALVVGTLYLEAHEKKNANPL